MAAKQYYPPFSVIPMPINKDSCEMIENKVKKSLEADKQAESNAAKM